MKQSLIRNFSIVAHIDHGKSTLADRLLQISGAVAKRDMKEQLLDSMDLERERGITIKASAVTIDMEIDGVTYMFNLIDTPGHVDFHYEVDRALAACDGALLVVDATQGVQAQTVANAYAAINNDLAIVPVVNKIDLPGATPEDAAIEIEHVLGISVDQVQFVSAKTGEGIPELIRSIAAHMPPPKGDPAGPLQALVFDSEYDDYRGVICYLRLVNGTIRKGQKILLMGRGRTYVCTELGKFRPKMTPCEQLAAGETGYMVAAIKTLQDVTVGDTVTDAVAPAPSALPGYEPPKQMVFCDFFPSSGEAFEELRDALARLSLNDASFTYQPQHSDALGFGFRCGFLGLLHMDIVQERLERECGVDVVQTAPSVTYEVQMTDGDVIRIDAAGDLPEGTKVAELREPWIDMQIITPAEAVGSIMQLAEQRRGIFKKQEYLSPTRVMMTYEFPFNEILYDFYDKLKSMTRGYGTMDYHVIGYRASDLVKLDILVNGKPVDALATILHRSSAERRGRRIIQRLREEIDRHLFEIPLQAAIGSKVIARETIKALRKNVTAKCYGGDVTRKRKLLEKQKEGKKRMKTVGNVDIPQKAFMTVLEPEE
ncbi:MAG: translation elongation factor 4 [Phycisphaerae bacterium]|nr:elongation factor 4 [Phycisphaerae bacterium]MCZ2400749.1 translation elongation factor 4 [Phycisphaerae bacterium]NUQ48379.1 elongation factor 4 [Phycisphaerae bacterium]